MSAREPPSLLEWPDGVLRAGVVFLLAVTLVAAAIRYAQSARDLHQTA